jgi:uncharacterized protein
MNHEAAAVIDFTAHALIRLRARVAALEAQNTALLSFARERAGADGLVHKAVLALLEASTLEHAVHIITADWVDMLGLDAIALAFEAEEQAACLKISGLETLASGSLHALMPGTPSIALENVLEGARIFGPAADLIRAQALIRLQSPEDACANTAQLGPGLLALGARTPQHFDGINTAPLLGFLGDVVARTLALWLNHTKALAACSPR